MNEEQWASQVVVIWIMQEKVGDVVKCESEAESCRCQRAGGA